MKITKIEINFPEPVELVESHRLYIVNSIYKICKLYNQHHPDRVMSVNRWGAKQPAGDPFESNLDSVFEVTFTEKKNPDSV